MRDKAAVMIVLAGALIISVGAAAAAWRTTPDLGGPSDPGFVCIVGTGVVIAGIAAFFRNDPKAQ
jgi:hypothetical protein